MSVKSVLLTLGADVAADFGAPSAFDPDAGVGRKFLKFSGAPPRLVFVPLTEKFGPPRAQGGGVNRPPADSNAMPYGRPLATRAVTVEAHLWGDDEDAAEGLLEALGRTLQKAMPGSFSLSTGEWFESGAGSDVRCGVAYICTLVIEVPLREKAATTATVRGVPLTPTFDKPGS